MRKLLLILAVVLLAVLVRMSFFTVDPTEYVYVTQLGEPVATYDGGDNVNGAGLHWRWPWPIQSVQRLDRRVQYFDLPVIELLTRDAKQKRIGKTLVAETYACWRIADRKAVDRFIRTIGTAEQARTILGQLINGQLNAQTSEHLRLEDLITTEPGLAKAKMEELCGNLLKLAPQVKSDYGIQLVDVRLRRFNHPASVRQDIFERIKSERQKLVQEIRSQAETEAANIKSKADEEARTLLAKAHYEEETLKGQADTEAAQIRNQAHSRDPDFYVFLKKMEKLHTILGDNKTVLLLSSHRALFDLLFQPPQPGSPMPPAVAGHAGTPPPAREVRRDSPPEPADKRRGGP